MDAQKVAQAVLSFRKAVLLAYNIDYEKFTLLLEKMLGEQKLVSSYIEEQWDKMRQDFAKWFINLDMSAQEAFFAAAFEKYGY